MNKRSVVAVLAGVLLMFGVACGDDDPSSAADTPSATDAPGATPVVDATGRPSGSLATLAAGQESCGYTAESTPGPYYVSGTRELEDGNLNYDELDGTPMKVGGYVYASDGNSDPVPGARIEIWHTDDAGAYHPQGQGPASDYEPDEISLRGYVMTDDDGYYEFTSIFPGEYEGRVRHIHVRLSADGRQPLVSQIITALPGDRVSPEQDAISRGLPSCQIVEFTDRGGVKTAALNFHIR